MATNTVLAKMAVQIAANTAQFNAQMKQSSNALKTFQATAQKVNSVLGSFGVTVGLFTLVSVLRSAVQSIIDFERELSTVRAITGATGSEFNTLKEDALRLGAATKFTATQVASLQVEYGRLGFTTNEILAATEATLQLATATGEDLANSALVAGSTIRAFGLDASETQRVVDVMASSFNKSALNLEGFSEAMKFVAPDAAAAGVSIEETTALLATLADSGIRNTRAGTALRRIFTDLTKDGRPARDRIQELADSGISLGDAFDEVGRIAQTALLVLAKGTEHTYKLKDALDDATGSGERAANIMQDNLAGSITRLTSAYDGLIQSQGVLAQGLREIVDLLTNLITAANNSTSEVSKYLSILINYTPNIVTLARAINSLFGGSVDDDAKKVLEKARAIEQTVKAAFDSGNVEAYIKALDQNIYKEEIIAEIRARQAKILEQSLEGAKPLLAKLQEQLEELQKAQAAAFNASDVIKYGVQIKALQEKINRLKSGTVEVTVKPILSDPLEGITLNTEELSKSLYNLSEVERAFEGITEAVAAMKDEMAETPDVLNFSEEMRKLGLVSVETGEILRGFAEAALVGLGESFGDAISGVQNFGAAFISSVAAFMGQLGRQMIALGVAKSILDKLSVVPGPALIAGGIALTAAARAVQNTLSGGIGGSSGGGGQNVRAATAINYNGVGQQINIGGEFTVRGQDLVVVLDKQSKRNSRTK